MKGKKTDMVTVYIVQSILKKFSRNVECFVRSQ